MVDQEEEGDIYDKICSLLEENKDQLEIYVDRELNLSSLDINFNGFWLFLNESDRNLVATHFNFDILVHIFEICLDLKGSRDSISSKSLSNYAKIIFLRKSGPCDVIPLIDPRDKDEFTNEKNYTFLNKINQILPSRNCTFMNINMLMDNFRQVEAQFIHNLSKHEDPYTLHHQIQSVVRNLSTDKYGLRHRGIRYNNRELYGERYYGQQFRYMEDFKKYYINPIFTLWDEANMDYQIEVLNNSQSFHTPTVRIVTDDTRITSTYGYMMM
ncbi:hypothetical protein BN7_5457 [Wickerhamomyces ciferrii]|uniref:Uncharacterized protein n=1 Tax=Wickerhamomyces ciferrii (strain ATCC 14091 / BCRC 22168 / CBS 111 / JCM 3599 / NBRC 0793 / NRRL Y-1031 F-60-10) TaxID=1206466 RepID=K0KKX7_WICCF|nr:uncharacterized protein BN7_5457 [Wickerhamomyces ciferrii]CCH45870.1 hypothetical protein BN7_5457 [Wickerhamomyces ciferrii]